MSGLFSVDAGVLPVFVVAFVVAKVVAHVLIRVFDLGFDLVFRRRGAGTPVPPEPVVAVVRELSPEEEPGWRAKAPVLEPQPGSLGDPAQFDVRAVSGLLPAETTGRHAKVEADPRVTEVMPAVVDAVVEDVTAFAVVAAVVSGDDAA